MSDTAEFTVHLNDEVSGPAKSAGQAFDDLGNALKPHNLLKSLTGSQLLTDGIEKLGSMAVNATVRLVELGIEGGKALFETVAFTERMGTAFNRLSHGALDGEKSVLKIANLAANLGLPVQDTIEKFSELLAMQFKPAMAEELIKMAADLQSLGGDAEKTKRVLLAITQIKAKGKLQSEELMQLAEANVSTELTLKALAKQTGKTTAEVQKLLQAGKITADQGIAAIGEAVKGKLGIQKFGEAGEAAAMSSLGGMVNVLKGKASVALIEVAQRLKKPLEEVLLPIGKDLLKAFESPEAKAVLDGFVAGVLTLGNAMRTAWPMVKQFVSGFLEGFKQGWKDLGPIFDQLKVSLKEVDWKTVGEGVAFVAAGMGRLVAMGAGLIAVAAVLVGPMVEGIMFLGEVFTTFVDNVETIGEQLVATLGGIGDSAASALIDGLVGGILGGVPAVNDAVASLGEGALGSLSSIWKSHSPSRAFEEKALDATAGTERGFERGTGGVISASAQMGAGALGAVGGGASRGAGVGNISVSMTINSDKADAKAVAEEIRLSLRSEFASILEGLDLEAGSP